MYKVKNKTIGFLPQPRLSQLLPCLWHGIIWGSFVLRCSANGRGFGDIGEKNLFLGGQLWWGILHDGGIGEILSGDESEF